ncbi:hypothetical protein [Nocardia sp. NPDC003979]
MGYKKGDEVVANKDLGGIVRDSVGAGSKGTVTGTDAFGNPTKVAFRDGDRTKEIRVNGREVR